jgi:regulator of nucleoside diphosphate kinase
VPAACEGPATKLAVSAPADPSARRLRTLTELDHARLPRLPGRTAQARHAELADALEQANPVPAVEVGHDVVTMYTRVRVDDLAGGSAHVYTLCYPSEAEPAAGFVSVLSPVGRTLLGARVGERVQVERPDGRRVELVRREILFQPEASGDCTT